MAHTDKRISWTLYDQYQGSGTPSYSSSTSFMPGGMDSSGERVTNWRERLKSHPVVTGQLSGSWSYGTVTPAYSARSGKDRQQTYHPWTPSLAKRSVLIPLTYLAPHDDTLTYALNQALAKLTNRYRESTQACMGIVVLGELRETLQFLMSPGRGIQQTLKSWMSKMRPYRNLARRKKKIPGKSLRRIERRIRDQWLETAYALRPLLSEAEQASYYFNLKSGELERLYDVFKATGTRKDASLTGVSTYTVGSFSAHHATRRVTTAMVKFRGAMMSYGTGPSARSIGFDPSSWAPSLYELIPYSFIVDYFSNLGDVVDTWAMRRVFTAGLQQTNFKESVHEKFGVKNAGQRILTSYQDTSITGFSGGVHRVREGGLDRKRIAALPVPVLRARCPGTSTKWINIIALADAFLDRRPKR